MDINQIPSLPDREIELRHPSPEQSLLREAVKRLTPKQRRIWDLHNFDRLTQEEIGKRLKITHQMVAKHIKACEKKITKWIKSNMGAYELLKHDFEEQQ